jgi:hypothetical protein
MRSLKMRTTREDIRGWLTEGRHRHSTHVIVVCDTFDHGDYPVFVQANESVRAKASEYANKEMQRVMEVYALHLDLEAQLSEHRSFHYENPPGHEPPPSKPVPRQKPVLKLVPPLPPLAPPAPLVAPMSPVEANPTAWDHAGSGHYRRRDGRCDVRRVNSHKWRVAVRDSEAGHAPTAVEAMRLADVAALDRGQCSE